jgi:hypothetical protein
MTKIVLNADIVSKMNFLYKHLLDDPAQNPTTTPKVDPLGNEIKSIKQVASILGVEPRIAGFYVLQDPTAAPSLKEMAREAVVPGIYVAPEDGFIPVLHKARTILSGDIDKKSVRIVRTVAGSRKYGQPLGAVILRDGNQTLNNITALPNDVPGFQKMQDKAGTIYYVGRRAGTYYVIDPAQDKILHTAKVEQGAYNWLNDHAGGGVQGTKPKKAKKT